MEKQRRHGAILSFLLSGVATACVASSFATDNWVAASLMGQGVNATSLRGNIRFGLFKGNKQRDVLGVQTDSIYVTCDWDSKVCGLSSADSSYARTDSIWQSYTNATANRSSASSDVYKDFGLFSFPLWISVEVLSAGAMFWGAVAMSFAALNAFIIPIETINGLQGLYLWNALAGICSLSSFIVFIVLYLTNLRDNVLLEAVDRSTWKVVDSANLDWSVWILAASTIIYGGAGSFAGLASARSGCCRHKQSRFQKVDEKASAMSILY